MPDQLPHIDLSNIPESLHPLLTTLLTIIEAQRVRIEELEAQVVKLNAQLNQNSQNSHRPPSQDQHPPKPKPAFPKTEKKNKGGQRGHKGNTLTFSDSPDVSVVLQPKICACGQCLQAQPFIEKERRQVFDIPAPTLHVTEYTQYQVRLRYREILSLAGLETPYQEPVEGRKRIKQSKERNLLERLTEYESAVLAFAFHEEVPFTNNIAEQSVRCSKVKQKVSGCFRLEDGAKRYARIESFIQTARKQKHNVFLQLKYALQGHTFLTHPNLTS